MISVKAISGRDYQFPIVDLDPGSRENKRIMAIPLPSQIENEFACLSPEDQLGLLERLIHRVRLNVSKRPATWDADLSAMAIDPQVQREISQINKEFSGSESDGLKKH
ncbi:MAG TPA: hypothetical protein VGE41_01915 [Verrucomicrobiae bacterium]